MRKGYSLSQKFNRIIVDALSVDIVRVSSALVAK